MKKLVCCLIVVLCAVAGVLATFTIDAHTASAQSVQGASIQTIYSVPTTLPLNETVSLLCLTVVLFVIGIVLIRIDARAYERTTASLQYAY